MALLIILFAVFAGITLMVILGERFGKPIEQEQQSKLSKIATVVCFVLIASLIVREVI